MKVSVWWDFENCNLPAGVNVFKVAHCITAAIRASGIKGPITITAFGDILQLSRANQEALSSTGINLTHVPSGGKNSADRSLLVDLMYWVSQHPPPAHLFLISGDRDFANILHRLRMNNYNILLASPESASDVLCSAASIMWHWHTLLRGEVLTGKHFNQPPDGPHGSWYGHYKVPLEDPFLVMKQAACSRGEELYDPGSDSKPRPVPKVVVKQIRQILSLYPKGISITELRAELSKSNFNIDGDYYGYKKFSRFLLSMPHILRLQSVVDGQYVVHGISAKAPEPFESSSCISTKPVYRNGDQDISLCLGLSTEDASLNQGMESKLMAFQTPKPRGEEPSPKMQHSNPANNSNNVRLDMEKHPEKMEEPLLADGKNVEVETVVFSKVEEDYPHEMGFVKRIWGRWFGSNQGSSETSRDEKGSKLDCSERKSLKNKEKCSNSSKSKEQEIVGAQSVKSPSSNADPACSVLSSSGFSELAEDSKTSVEASNYKSGSNLGFFNWIPSWWKFWRRSTDTANGSDQSCQILDHVTSHSKKHVVFTDDYFWSDMKAFLNSARGSATISQSKTREQMAKCLQREGPIALQSLSDSDIFQLVDMLVSEKKWIKVCPSQMPLFQVACPAEKNPDVGHSHAANGLRSIFLEPQLQSNLQEEHDREKKLQNTYSEVSESGIYKSLSNKSRSEILADCQKLVKEVTKEYPEGYSMGSFKKLFLERYGYPLDIQKLGYKKLTTLLQMMPGIRIASYCIFPSRVASKASCTEIAFHNIEEKSDSHLVSNSDRESSGTSRREDDLDSPFEELGPVSNSTPRSVLDRRIEGRNKESLPDYEPSLSDDNLSDSEEETSPVKQNGFQRKAGVNEEDSSLLQILDSWRSSKEDKKSEDVDGVVDSSSDGLKLSGLSRAGSNENCLSQGRKRRMQKSYSFVSDSVSNNKDKLIDGILGSLRKSSESKMQG